MNVKKCSMCGKEFYEGEQFCSICGGILYVPNSSFNSTQQAQTIQFVQSNQPAQYTQMVGQTQQVMQPMSPNQKDKKKLPKWAYIIMGGFGALIILLVVLSSICFHEWNPATCLAPETCAECGKTRGETLDHEWVEASCKSPKTCAVCKTTEGEALGHSVKEWKNVSKSTCTAKGKDEGTCTVCKETVIKELDLLSHTKGKWEVTKSATKNSKGEQCIKCTVCKAVIETKEYELSPEEIEKEYKSKCEKYSYDKIARSPNEYKGKQARIYGKVLQVMQQKLAGSIFYTLRIGTGGSYYYDNVVYVVYSADENEPRILEDDMVTVYGELKGEYTYETVMGNEITIPYMSGEYID